VSFSLRDGTLAGGIAAGVLFGIEFLLIFPALQFTSASRATLFIYTAPFVVALGASVLLGERLRAVQWIGLLCSFAGLVVAFGRAGRVGRQALIGDIMMVGAGVAWGRPRWSSRARTCARRRPRRCSPIRSASRSDARARDAARGRAHDGHAERLVARLARLSDVLGGEPHLRGVFRHGAALFGEADFRPSHSSPHCSGWRRAISWLGEPVSWGFGAAVALVIAGLVLVNRPN
jgi:multidrug transporter EmrE-like cation transporter